MGTLSSSKYEGMVALQLALRGFEPLVPDLDLNSARDSLRCGDLLLAVARPLVFPSALLVGRVGGGGGISTAGQALSAGESSCVCRLLPGLGGAGLFDPSLGDSRVAGSAGAKKRSLDGSPSDVGSCVSMTSACCESGLSTMGLFSPVDDSPVWF